MRSAVRLISFILDEINGMYKVKTNKRSTDYSVKRFPCLSKGKNYSTT